MISSWVHPTTIPVANWYLFGCNFGNGGYPVLTLQGDTWSPLNIKDCYFESWGTINFGGTINWADCDFNSGAADIVIPNGCTFNVCNTVFRSNIILQAGGVLNSTDLVFVGAFGVTLSGGTWLNKGSSYDPTISGLIATDLQGAIDELSNETLRLDCSNDPLTGTLDLKAGSTTAAPLKFTSGDLLTNTEIGAIEFQTDDYYGSTTTPLPAIYTSYYPPAYSGTYVKATSADWGAPYYAVDPSQPLTGGWGNSWLAYDGPSRFHIDLGTGRIINRIYYENNHDSGSGTTFGVKDFTLWGTNSATAFAELTYNTDTDWVQITGLSQTYFDEHIALDQVDPKYITFSNSTSYRYYAFKFANNRASNPYLFLRRVTLQYGLSTYRRNFVLTDTGKLTDGRIPFATTNGRLTDSANLTYNGSSIVNGSGSVFNTTRITAATYTALATDEIIFLDTDANAIALTLPAGVDGTHYKIINCGSSGNNVTVIPNGAETVNNAATQTLYDGDVYDIHYETTEKWWG